jgi:hypothetical protein
MGSNSRSEPAPWYDVVRRPASVLAAVACWLLYAAAILAAAVWLAVSMAAVHGAGVLWEILHFVVVLTGFGVTLTVCAVSFHRGRPWARGMLTGLAGAGIAVFLVLSLPDWLSGPFRPEPHSPDPPEAPAEFMLRLAAGLVLFVILPTVALALTWRRSASLWSRNISA